MVGSTTRLPICERASESPPMKRPVIGVIANTHLIENRFTAHLVGENSLRAVADVTGALPMMFAGSPDITEIGALLETVDGVLLTGGRANAVRTGEDRRRQKQGTAARGGEGAG